jgi:hypothetical protein
LNTIDSDGYNQTAELHRTMAEAHKKGLDPAMARIEYFEKQEQPKAHQYVEQQ